MFYYIPFKEHLYSDEIGSYTAFGIRSYDSLNKESFSVSDVSVSRSVVLKLCINCTVHQLEPIHLLDVIMNYI